MINSCDFFPRPTSRSENTFRLFESFSNFKSIQEFTEIIQWNNRRDPNEPVKTRALLLYRNF